MTKKNSKEIRVLNQTNFVTFFLQENLNAQCQKIIQNSRRYWTLIRY